MTSLVDALTDSSWAAFERRVREIHLPAGTPVWVTAVQGTTLTVWPVDGSSGYIDVDALHPPAPSNEELASEEAEGDEA